MPALAIETGTAPSTQTWTLDSTHSTVEFAVKHLMISNVKGRFSDIAATLEADRAGAPGFQLDVTIGAASIDTRQEQRDAHLRSPDFFDVEQWPEIRFIGKRIEGDVNDAFKLTGDLTIRDSTKEFTLSVTNEGRVVDPWGNARVGFTASGKLDRSDFGLTWNQALEAGGFMVGNEIKVSVDVQFTADA